MIGAHPLLEMRARSWRRALSTWRRYSASTTGAAIPAAAGAEPWRSEAGGGGGEEACGGRQDCWGGEQRDGTDKAGRGR